MSTINVDIKSEYWSDRLPQVWDELRKKIRDVTPELPPGAGTPIVVDDFGFVYGFVLALTGDLGAGKTELTRGLARALGVPRDVHVSSPSYLLPART